MFLGSGHAVTGASPWMLTFRGTQRPHPGVRPREPEARRPPSPPLPASVGSCEGPPLPGTVRSNASPRSHQPGRVGAVRWPRLGLLGMFTDGCLP